MFEINEAIAGWRARLSQAETMGTADLDELESHVREEAATLSEIGLEEEEAFWLAARRIGPPEQVALEYGNGNPRVLWQNRAKWMAWGILGYLTVLGCSRLAEVAGKTVTVMLGLGPAAAVWIGMGLNLLVLLFGIFSFFALQQGRLGFVRWALAGSKAIPILVMLFVFLVLLAIVGKMASNLLLARFISTPEFGRMALVQAYWELALGVLIPICLAVVTWRMSRIRSVAAPASR